PCPANTVLRQGQCATPTSTETPSPTMTFTSTSASTSTKTPTPTPCPTDWMLLQGKCAPIITSTVERSTATAQAQATARARLTATALVVEPVAGAIRQHEGVPFVFIPAGEFAMGADDEDSDGDASPIHMVFLDEYWIMQTEVTNFQFSRCVDAGACRPPDNLIWKNVAYAEYPVTDVNWSDAANYAKWVGGALPTEAQWEKACRGTDGRIYPWGAQEPSNDLANFDYLRGGVMPAGSYWLGRSPYGVLDMSGNVAEWIRDWYDDNFYSVSPLENPVGPMNGNEQVVRGGSFISPYTRSLRCSSRIGVAPDRRERVYGFRVVRSSVP
ncbi:MAG: SUMF1/EgtB/PvdO family nonheme iron enzyme, partial [Chloroflexota bacterium]